MTETVTAARRRRGRQARKLPKEDMMPANMRALVEDIMKAGRVGREDAEWMLHMVAEVLARNVASGRGFRITGVGTVTLKKLAPRMRRNPQTGEMILVDGKNVPKLVPGQRLLDVMNGELKLRKGDKIVAKKPRTL